MGAEHTNLTYKTYWKYWYFCPKHYTSNKDRKLRAIYIQINTLTRQRISKLTNNSKLVYFSM